jgi:hypothetical protein
MATQLQDSLPVALSYSYGPETLNELLHGAFGSGADIIPKVEVSYGGAAFLASKGPAFGYWEPENPGTSDPRFFDSELPGNPFPIERTNFDGRHFRPRQQHRSQHLDQAHSAEWGGTNIPSGNRAVPSPHVR